MWEKNTVLYVRLYNVQGHNQVQNFRFLHKPANFATLPAQIIMFIRFPPVKALTKRLTSRPHRKQTTNARQRHANIYVRDEHLFARPACIRGQLIFSRTPRQKPHEILAALAGPLTRFEQDIFR